MTKDKAKKDFSNWICNILETSYTERYREILREEYGSEATFYLGNPRPTPKYKGWELVNMGLRGLYKKPSKDD